MMAFKIGWNTRTAPMQHSHNRSAYKLSSWCKRTRCSHYPWLTPKWYYLFKYCHWQACENDVWMCFSTRRGILAVRKHSFLIFIAKSKGYLTTMRLVITAHDLYSSVQIIFSMWGSLTKEQSIHWSFSTD